VTRRNGPSRTEIKGAWAPPKALAGSDVELERGDEGGHGSWQARADRKGPPNRRPISVTTRDPGPPTALAVSASASILTCLRRGFRTLRTGAV
jgi:hypothetical protein